MKVSLKYHFGFWSIAFIMMFLTMWSIMDIKQALFNSCGFLFPLILPVSILDILQRKYLQRKEYWRFFVGAAITLGVFAPLNYYLIKLINSPESESNTIFSILITFLVFSGIQYFQRGLKQQLLLHKAESEKAKTDLRLKQIESEMVRAELNSLKSQLNPHFLFNTLNNIYSQILDKSDQAGDSVVRLSLLMRYIVDSSKKEKVKLNEEIQFLRDYIALEKIRLEDQAIIRFEMNSDNNSVISPLIFIQFVENCFKHGISSKTANNQIEIKLNQSKDEVRFYTKNYIAGKRIDSKHNGMGLTNIQKRLSLLYPGKHSLEIIRENKQFETNLIIQIN